MKENKNVWNKKTKRKKIVWYLLTLSYHIARCYTFFVALLFALLTLSMICIFNVYLPGCMYIWTTWTCIICPCVPFCYMSYSILICASGNCSTFVHGINLFVVFYFFWTNILHSRYVVFYTCCYCSRMYIFVCNVLK